jgi:hypothetical protein
MRPNRLQLELIPYPATEEQCAPRLAHAVREQISKAIARMLLRLAGRDRAADEEQEVHVESR